MWIQAGLDFGNENLVLSVPGQNGVTIVSDPESGRVTPASVTYTGLRRYFGGASVREQIANTKSTINNLKKLICLPYNSREREILSSKVDFPLCEAEDGLTAIEVDFQEKKVILRPEQVLAFALKRMVKAATAVDSRVGALVVAISPVWSERKRRAIYESCKIGDVKCTALMNSTTGPLITYTMTHGSRLPVDKPVPVVFCDFGNSGMNVVVANLKQGSVEVLSVVHDEELAGWNFTDVLATYLMEKVKHKYSIDPTGNTRAMLRFRNAVEKLKKTLSINPVVTLDVPSMANDVDVSFLVKRDEFVTQIGSLIDKIPGPIEKALELANVKKEDVGILEVLGGGSRIPAIRAKIAEIFGKEPTQSVNLEECVAIGAGYIAGLFSPGVFRIPLVVRDVCPFPITASWSDGHPKNQEIFPRFSETPSSTNLSVKVAGKTEIRLNSEGQDIAIISITSGIEQATEVTIRFRLNQSCMVEIESASYKREEEEIPVASLQVVYPTAIDPEKMEQMRALEKAMTESDLHEEAVDMAKNDLEASMFALEATIRDDKDFFSEEEKAEGDKLLEEIRTWYDEHEYDRLSIEEYSSNRDKMTVVTNKISKRAKAYREAQEKIEQIAANLDDTEKKLKADKKHSDDDEMESIQESIDKLKTAVEEFNKVEKSTELTVDIESMEKEAEELANRQKALKAKPLPKQQNWAPKKQPDDNIRRNRLFGYDGNDWDNRQQDDEWDDWGPFFGIPRRRPRYPQRKTAEEIEEEREEEREQELARQEEERRREELARAAEEKRRRERQLAKEREQQRRLAEAERQRRADQLWSDPWGIPQPRPERKPAQSKRREPTNDGWGGGWGSNWNDPFW